MTNAAERHLSRACQAALARFGIMVRVHPDQDRAVAWGRDQLPLLEAWERRNGYIRARLYLYDNANGGRSTPVVTGFRASWHFGEMTDAGRAVVHDAPLLVEGADLLPPGGEAVVRLHPLHPDLWPRVIAGATFSLWEGNLIGEATMIEMVPAA